MPLSKNCGATYLGNELNQQVNVKDAIFNKLQSARMMWLKMMPYWKASGSRVKWKLRIFNAIAGAKLLYGLETIYLTKSY